jgi:hypothetical protein
MDALIPSTSAPKRKPSRGQVLIVGCLANLSVFTSPRIETMFDRHRAESLAAEIMAISEIMTTVTEEQRAGILDHPDDQLARLDAVVSGLMRTQIQLVAAVGVLTTTLLEYLLDEEHERGLGIAE